MLVVVLLEAGVAAPPLVAGTVVVVFVEVSVCDEVAGGVTTVVDDDGVDGAGVTTVLVPVPVLMIVFKAPEPGSVMVSLPEPGFRMRVWILPKLTVS